MIAYLKALLMALPEVLRLLDQLARAYREHQKKIVRREIDEAFNRLKDAKTRDEKYKALHELDSNWKR